MDAEQNRALYVSALTMWILSHHNTCLLSSNSEQGTLGTSCITLTISLQGRWHRFHCTK